MLNSTGESKHPCLVFDLRGKVFSVSPLSMMSALVTKDSKQETEELQDWEHRDAG